MTVRAPRAVRRRHDADPVGRPARPARRARAAARVAPRRGVPRLGSAPLRRPRASRRPPPRTHPSPRPRRGHLRPRSRSSSRSASRWWSAAPSSSSPRRPRRCSASRWVRSSPRSVSRCCSSPSSAGCAPRAAAGSTDSRRARPRPRCAHRERAHDRSSSPSFSPRRSPRARSAAPVVSKRDRVCLVLCPSPRWRLVDPRRGKPRAGRRVARGADSQLAVLRARDPERQLPPSVTGRRPNRAATELHRLTWAGGSLASVTRAPPTSHRTLLHVHPEPVLLAAHSASRAVCPSSRRGWTSRPRSRSSAASTPSSPAASCFAVAGALVALYAGEPVMVDVGRGAPLPRRADPCLRPASTGCS